MKYKVGDKVIGEKGDKGIITKLTGEENVLKDAFPYIVKFDNEEELQYCKESYLKLRVTRLEKVLSKFKKDVDGEFFYEFNTLQYTIEMDLRYYTKENRFILNDLYSAHIQLSLETVESLLKDLEVEK